MPIPTSQFLHRSYTQNNNKASLQTNTMLFKNNLLKFVTLPFVHLFDRSNVFVSCGTPSLVLNRNNEKPLKKSDDNLSFAECSVDEEPVPVFGLIRWTDSHGNRRMRSTRVRKPPSRYGCIWIPVLVSWLRSFRSLLPCLTCVICSVLSTKKKKNVHVSWLCVLLSLDSSSWLCVLYRLACCASDCCLMLKSKYPMQSYFIFGSSLLLILTLSFSWLLNLFLE